MNMLKHWLRSATKEEKEDLVKLVDTSLGYLNQLANDHRQAKAEMAAKIERAAHEIRIRTVETKRRLPKLYRGDISAACAKCPYFKNQCEGEEE